MICPGERFVHIILAILANPSMMYVSTSCELFFGQFLPSNKMWLYCVFFRRNVQDGCVYRGAGNFDFEVLDTKT